MDWNELEAACAACTGCELYKTRTNLVFGCGNRSAELMFVGEGPGEREDATGIPFVGAAGMLLDKYLCAVGINREDVYIANLLKCRPPHNRDPLPAEGDACIGFLRCQVKLIKPRMIVCLGRISAARLIHPEYRITKEHGEIIKRGSYALTAVFHPAALLRDSSKKEDMLRDMKKIKAYLDAIDTGGINPPSL